DRPQVIAERQIRMPFGKGRVGHTGGFFRDRRDDVWVERHARRPSAEGVKTRQTSRSVLCHSPLARSTPWREGSLCRYFILQKSLLYQPASIMGSATLCFSRWTQWRGRQLHRCQNRREHRARLLTEKALRSRRPVRP